MQGYALWYRPRATRNNVEAIRIFERALEIDPRSLDARVGIAKILVSNVTQAWTDTAEQDIARAEDRLLQALEQDAGCALAHSTMGMVRREQWSRAIDVGCGTLEDVLINFFQAAGPFQ